MSDLPGHLPTILAVVLALAVLLAWTRLPWWQRGAPPAERSRPWRLASLLLLQPVCAALLYYTLLPPGLPGEAGTLVVATAGTGASQAAAGSAGERLVALPEAPALDGAERVPDLATALRRHPGSARVRVIGAGLEPRDRDAARGLVLAFDAPALAPGLLRVQPPRRIAAGARYQVSGQVHGVEGGSVELLDPAGRRLDARPLLASGNPGPIDGVTSFVLEGSARVPGLAVAGLRVLDAGGEVVETLEVPLWIAADPPPRVLVLAGAPGPELKYLRRWAEDAGLDLHVQVSLGGGLQLGDAPLPIDAAALQGFDALVLDERSTASLGASQRAAIGEAVHAGLGLLLRVGGAPAASTRAQWRALGLDVAGGRETTPARLALAAVIDVDARRALRGPGSADAPVELGDDVANVPVLTRRNARAANPDASVLLHDETGNALTSWRANGRGRVALWTLADSYRLVLAGHPDLHAQLWSETFGSLVRPAGAAMPRIDPEARVEQRLRVCALADGAQVLAPDGQATQLLLDPGAGPACAGYWPRVPGWHWLQQGEVRWPFHVRDMRSGSAMHLAELREATLALQVQPRAVAAVTAATSAAPATANPTTTNGPPTRRGSHWPWFLAWLCATSLLWWLERSAAGRRRAVP